MKSAPKKNIFISYSVHDLATARSISQNMTNALPNYNIFLSPYSIKAGARHVPALATAIENCDIFIIIRGKQLGEWQKIEYDEAFYQSVEFKKTNGRSIRIIPLVITQDPPNLPFVRTLHNLRDFNCDNNVSMNSLFEAIEQSTTDVSRDFWRVMNPFRGIEALREEDSDNFYGRTSKIDEALNWIANDDRRFLMFIGNSGVGKSSLIQAGIIPSLRRQSWSGPTCNPEPEWPRLLQKSRSWLYLTVRILNNPVRSLVSAFCGLWFTDSFNAERAITTNTWEEAVLNGATLLELASATDAILLKDGLPPPEKYFIYIDQMEEIYSNNIDYRKRERAISLIVDAANSDRFVMCGSQRSDYYGEFQSCGNLFRHSNKIDVPPLSTDELESVISLPVLAFGARFERNTLAREIAESLCSQPGGLPIAADLMHGLWEGMRAKNDAVIRMPVRIQDIPVGATIAQKADEFLRANPNKQQEMRRLFTLRLVHVDDANIKPQRIRFHKKLDIDELWRVAEDISNKNWRIITLGSDSDGAYAEISHDVLIDEWRTLKNWIAEERRFLLWRQKIRRNLEAWIWYSPWKKEYALISEADVEEADGWLKTKRKDMDEDIILFIKKSRSFRRQKRWVAAVIATLFAGFGMVILAALFSETGISVYWLKPIFVIWRPKTTYEQIYTIITGVLCVSAISYVIGFNIYKLVRKLLSL